FCHHVWAALFPIFPPERASAVKGGTLGCPRVSPPPPSPPASLKRRGPIMPAVPFPVFSTTVGRPLILTRLTRSATYSSAMGESMTRPFPSTKSSHSISDWISLTCSEFVVSEYPTASLTPFQPAGLWLAVTAAPPSV